ncbi:MAG: NADH-quinone oxidoreductase subunit J [Planctomycetota bacterium]
MLQRIFYGVLTLLTLAALGVGLASAGAEGLAFGLFAAMTIGGALVCIWERSVVRSAFSLMATFTGVAGFFILLESAFLAMAQLLIYVGGILALLLFGVMMSPPDLAERSLWRVLPGLGLVGLAVGWVSWQVAGSVDWVVRAGTPTGGAEAAIGTAERIGVGFLAPDQYVVAFELAGVVLTVALVASVYIARRRVSDLEPLPKEQS